MSTEVDKRVVEMQFKNEQFERGAKTSMDTVEKLKKSLDFDGAANSLKKLGDTSKSVTLESLAASVDQISSRFSTLGIIGMTALQNITNSAINAGKQLLASLTIAPIKQGFEEYQLQMNSVQTIMAGTGESLETVTKYLDELNTYADKTIYSFSDMTANIGKFTNAGVSLKDAVAAIQGISNEAAVSGANAQQASHAMYNFAQALSAGYVKLIDWKSIENANMATKEFKEQLIDTAVKMGTLTKSTDGMYTTLKGNTLSAVKDFNDSLKDEWMTTDVLVGTLAKYSDETTDIGKKAFAAAGDVKTFTQLLDTLKEAAGSGWAQTWKLVIGDFDEAKDLFTKMSEEFGGIIQKMADARNDLLEGALGNFSKYADKNWHEVHDVLQTSQQEFMSAPLWSWMDKRVHTNAAYRQGLLEAAEAAGKLTKVEDGLYSTGNHLISATSSSSQWMASLTDNWLTSASAAEGLRKAVGDVNEAMTRASGRDLLIGSFKNIWDSLKSIFGAIRDGFRTIFPKMSSETLYKIIEGFNKLTEALKKALKPGSEILNNLKRTFAGLFAVIDIIIQPIKFFVQAIIELIKFVAPAGDGILNLTGNLGDFLVSVDKAIKDSGVFAKALSGFKDILTTISDAVKGTIDYVKDVITVIKDWASGNKKLSDSLDKAKNKTDGFAKSVEILVGIGKVFYTIGSAIGNFFKKIWEGLKWLWNLPFVQAQVKRFGGAFKEVGKNIMDSMGPTSKAFGEFMDRLKELDGFSLENVWKVIKDFTTNVAGTFFSGVFGSLKPLGKAFLDFFADLFGKIAEKLNLAGLKPLADMADKVKDFFASFGKASDGEKGISNLEKFGDSLSHVSNVFSAVGDTLGPAFEKIGGFVSENLPAIITMLTGVVIVRGIKKISDLGDALVTGIKAVASGFQGIGKILIGTSQVIVNFGKLLKATAFGTYAEGILKIVQAFMILVVALIALTFIDTDKLWDALKVLGALAGILAGFIAVVAVMTSKFESSPKQLLSMVAIVSSFAGAMLLLAFAVLIMGAAKNAMQSVDVFAAMIIMLIGIIVTLGVAFKNNDKSIKNTATAIIAFGAAIMLMAVAFRIMDGVQNIVQDVIIFAGMLIGLVLITKALGKNEKSTMAGAAALVAFGAAIMLISAAFMIMDGIKNPLPSLLIFAGMVAGLVIFVAAVGKMKNQAKTSAALLLSFAGAILIIAAAMAIIGLLKPEQIIVSLLAISVVMGLLIGVIAISKSAGKEAHKAGALLIGLGASLLMIAFAMQILGGMNTNSMKRALTCITIIGVIFVAIIAISKIAGKHAMQAGMMLLAMSASLIILAGVIWILGSLDPGVALRGTLAVSALMVVMGILLTLGKEAKSSVKYVIAITACIVMLGVMVAALSMIEPARLAIATAALDSLMICFAVLMRLSKGAGKVNASIFILIGVVAALGLLVAALSEYMITDGSKFLKVATGISELMVAMGVFAELISNPNVSKLNPGTAAKVTGALDIALGMIVGAIAGIGAIVNAIDSFTGGGASAAIEKGLEVLVNIAHGIGKAIGSFIGGIGEGISDSLPAIADNISLFGEKLKPFFDVITNLPEGAEGKMGQIVAAIGVLTASDFIYSLTQFFGGKSFEEYGAELSAFGDGLKTFVGSISDITDDDLNRIKIASEATKLLSDAFANLPTEGGFFDLIFGETISGEDFGKQITVFGEMLMAFRDSVKDLSEDDVAAINVAAKAAKALTDVANSVPNSGGLLGLLAGENDIDDFGVKLAGFGAALALFAESVSGLTEEDAAKWEMIANGVQHLIDMGNTLQNSGGVLGFLAGENDLGELGGQLSEFGSGLKEFSDSIKDLNKGHMQKWKTLSESIQPLIDMGNTLKNDGGFISIFTGDNGLDDLGNQLKYFGEGLASYSESISGMTSDDVEHFKLVTEAAKTLVELGNSLDTKNDGGFISFFTGDNGLDDFGDQLGKFGEGIAAFADKTSGISESLLTSMGYACEAAGKLIGIGNKGTDLNSFIGISFENFEGKAEAFGKGMVALGTNLEGFGNGHIPLIAWAKTGALSLSGIGEAESGITAFLNIAFDGLEGKAEAFGKGMSAFSKYLSSDFNKDTADNITSAASAAAALSALGGMSDNFSSFMSLSLDDFASQAESFCKGINALSTNLSEFTSDDVDTVKNAYDAVGEIVDISQLVESVGVVEDLSSFNDFTTILTATLDRFASDCAEVLKSTENIDAVLDFTKTMATKLNESASLLNTETALSMDSALNSLIDTILRMDTINNSNVDAFISMLGDLADNAINNFSTKITSGTEKATSAVTTLLQAIVNIATSAQTNVVSEFIKLATGIVSAIANTLASGESVGKLKAAGALLLSYIVSGFASADKSSLSSSVYSISTSIVSAVNSQWGAMYSAGQHLMDGLALGIKIKQSNVVNAASEVLNATLTKINEKLKINSPSKVTMGVGKSMDEGLALGLVKNSKLTENAGEEVVDSALNNMTDSMNKISSLVNEDLDSAPVITPVIDSSMVESGINGINSMFSEQQALKVADAVSGFESSESSSDIKELIKLNKSMLSAIRSGGDIYLNENLIIGRINRRLGAL